MKYIPLPYLNRENQFLKLLRLQHYLWIKCKPLSYIVHNKICYKYGCDISQKVAIPYSTVFPHAIGIVIGEGVIIEENVTIYQNVTIGQKDGLYPKICANAKIYGGSTVIGGITVGEYAIIGAGSVVIKSIQRYEVAAGNPARILNVLCEK